MSKCTRSVDQGVIACKAWADTLSQQCTTWADEGSNACGQWADEGSSHCCTWWPCSWACDAYYWVAKWVCKAWYWVAKWVCKAWALVVKVVCTLWAWVAKLVCVTWGTWLCALSLFLKPMRRAKSPPKIRKVFVLMLENRSFDHMLGFAGLQGRDAVTGQPTTAESFTGKDLDQAPFTNADPGGGSAKPTADAPFAIPPEDKDPGHEFLDTLQQLTGSTIWNDSSAVNAYPPAINTGFIANYRAKGSAHPKNIMKSYDPKQVPVLTALAREFAVCDQWFSSMPGPTWPNRFFIHSASSAGLDDSPSGLETAVSELLDGYRFAHGSIYDRLDENCLNWRVFEGDEFPQVFAISGMELNALEGRFTDFDQFASAVGDPNYQPVYTFIEPNYGNILPTTAGDFTCGNSQHPLDDITRGEQLIKDVYEALRNSPHWESSALVITYDEHGGFFDSVPPPAAVAPGDPIASSANNHHNFDFKRLGVRVPAVVVSPLIPRGTIDHTPYDHTSVLRTVGRLFGLKPLTKRDAAAMDFLHLFSLGQARTDTPTTLPDPAVSGFTCETGLLTDLTDASALAKSAASNPVPAALWGFMRVALRKSWMSMGPAAVAERQKLTADFKSARTEAAAREFIHNARKRLRGQRNPGSEPTTLILKRKKDSN